MLMLRAVLAGLIGGLAMALFEMLYEAIGGAGFWSPVVFISATSLRDLQSSAVPVAFEPLPVGLGLMGHMLNSVVLGLIFAWLAAPRLRSLTGLVIGGAVYGLIVFTVQWIFVLPIVDPVMLKLNALAFGASHVVYGATLGLVLGWGMTPARAPHQAVIATGPDD
jgi:hypothetical protein